MSNSNIVNIYNGKAGIDRPDIHPFREISTAKFAEHIRSKICTYSSAFEFGELTVLGGLPDLEAQRPLSEIFYVFLSDHIGRQRRGFPPGESMMNDLVERISSDKLAYNPRLRLINPKGEVTGATKLLAASVLMLILQEKRYYHFKTPDVSKGIADFILKEAENFIYVTEGAKKGTPYYADSMCVLYKKLMGTKAFAMSHDEDTVGHYIRNAFPALKEQDVSKYESISGPA